MSLSQTPGRQRDLAAPFLPKANLARLAEVLDKSGCWVHSQEHLPFQEDCSLHRGQSTLGWIETNINHLDVSALANLDLEHRFTQRTVSPTTRKVTSIYTKTMYPEKTQSRVVYWPETLCFRGEVVGWQQVSSRNARILTNTVTPLRPQHPLDFLKQKCTSCCQSTITTVVFNKYHRHGYRWAKWIWWIINNWLGLRVCNDPLELLHYF